MVSAPVAAWMFAWLIGLAAAFQIALALGAPWGMLAMGGAHPGAYPSPLRAFAFLAALSYVAMGAIVAAHAGLGFRFLSKPARWLVWIVVALMALSLALNLASPSTSEKMLWGPISLLLLMTSLRVAVAKPDEEPVRRPAYD